MQLRGLYVLTPPIPASTQALILQTEQALLGGAVLVQYRDKKSPPPLKLERATALLELCHRYHVPLLINDNVELSSQIGAQGVHLGKADMTVAQARAVLGPQSIIGVSCYNKLELALHAQQAGADYVAFGSVYPSATKPNAVKADLELLRQARIQIDLPIVAIGGITPGNTKPLVEAGVDLVAVIDAVFNSSDIQTSANRFKILFE